MGFVSFSTKKSIYVTVVVATFLMTLIVLRHVSELTQGIPFLNTMSKAETPEGREAKIRTTLDSSYEGDMTWPSLKDTSITVEEIQLKYNRCRTITVQTNPKCAELHDHPDLAWKSTAKAGNSKQEDFQRLTLASICCVFYYEEIMKPAPQSELFPWEKYYLSTPLLQNISDISQAAQSSISFISSPGSNNTFALGSEVRFKVELYNGRNERMTRGGDKVDVWLSSDDLHAAITADVTDNQDGTYTAVTILPWSGTVNVKATIAHHKELLRTVMYLQRVFKSTHWFTGNFISSGAAEATLCSPFTNLPGYTADQVCNLTEINGYPWYCGKPVKAEFLNCSHFTSEAKLFYPSYMPMTEEEESLLTLTERHRPFLIPSNLSINVLADQGPNTTLPLPEQWCHERDLPLTFDDNNSYGFFYHGRWRPMACQLQDVNADSLAKCLQDTTVIFVGDSNSRKQMELLSSMVSCVHKIHRASVIWHAPLRCDNNQTNMSIQYFPHNFPFYGSQKEEVNPEVLYSEARLLDSLPKHGRYVVHLHTFLHLTPFHFSILDHRLRVTREAIQRLLDRNPHVIIVYQSAHSAYDRRPGNYHKLGVFLVELQRSILRGLGDRVMFSLTWPMTVAVANDDEHPPISNQFAKYYLGYICGRLK